MAAVTNDSNENINQTYDAQVLTEEIAAGEEKAPKINVEADYEASKQYSQSEVDQTEMGAELAKAATAPQFEVTQADSPNPSAAPTGDPTEFLEMAKEINPQLKD